MHASALLVNPEDWLIRTSTWGGSVPAHMRDTACERQQTRESQSPLELRVLGPLQSVKMAQDNARSEAAEFPGWFTPLRLLFIFCLTNMMVYLDRGTFSG